MSMPDEARSDVATAREQQVLELLAVGDSNKVIAFKLGCSDATVKSHIGALLDKYSATNRTHLAYLAVWRERMVLPARPGAGHPIPIHQADTPGVDEPLRPVSVDKPRSVAATYERELKRIET